MGEVIQGAAKRKGIQYEIQTVADFLKIPEDRQADCLSEFADSLDTARTMIEIVKAAGIAAGVDTNPTFGPFIWIDDGKRDQTVEVRTEMKGGAA